MTIVSDIHGCWFTLVRLLNQCATRYPGERLAFGGDLIDRGPNSRKVVEFAMENAIPTVKGNHEHLALAYHGRVPWRGFYGYQGVWLANGGDTCLASFEAGGTETLREETEEGGIIIPAKVRVGSDTELPKAVLDWFDQLPYYLIPDEERDESGRSLLLSHTGYGLETAGKGRDLWFHALWGRHGLDSAPFPEDGHYRVFGHSQQKEPEITETYAMVDTGAAYAKSGYGTMTAFHWPSKEVVQQAFDETPVEATFKVVEGRLT